MEYDVCGGASPLARPSAAATSSAVRFFDSRKATRLSTGDAATVGSWRTGEVVSMRVKKFAWCGSSHMSPTKRISR